ncbi:MAG: DUF4386 domain-containing protein [Nocardioidaceae bacterium]
MPGQSPQQRRTARIAGVWFVITFVASIPALLLYDPVLNDTGYILGAGADTRVELGAFLEIATAIAGIATAVVLFPIVKRQSEAIALGYVATRVLESTIIVVGLISLLAVVTLRQDLVGAVGTDPAALDAVGRALVAVKDGTFLLGPAYCAGLGNGLLLGYLMYRSGLVPPRMALLGVIGGPLSAVGATFVLFGAWEQTSATQFIFTIPEIIWEASLGIYLIVKGFRPSPILDDARYAGGDGGSLRPAAAAP